MITTTLNRIYTNHQSINDWKDWEKLHGDNPMCSQAVWNRKVYKKVDELMSEAGFAEDSSVRNILGMMNFDTIAKTKKSEHTPLEAELLEALKWAIRFYHLPHTYYYGHPAHVAHDRAMDLIAKAEGK